MNIYFECSMGAAGDMLASALVDLFENKKEIVDELNSLLLPHTVVEYGEKKQNGINGVHLGIIIDGEEETPESHHHHHHHSHGRGLNEIYKIIDALNVSGRVKEDVKSIYKIIAEAEAKAHNASAGEVHFHELGTYDAIADITITSYLLRKLSPERIITSPINVGGGTVKCAHGILPVPAPATADILTGVPYYKSEIKTELCTPTGASLLKYFTDEFVSEPKLDSVIKTGIGTGNKQFEQANILRVFAFDSTNSVTELACNIDDMTGEESAFAVERLLDEGALDCFISPVYMKKGRPAYLLTVLCKNNEAEKFAKLIFRHTTTIGIRKYTPGRYTLEREFDEKQGVQIKRSEGYGTVKEKIEFEDLKRLALEKDISIFEARQYIQTNTD